MTLQVSGDYPRTGKFEIKVELRQADRFSMVLRVPDWVEGFEAIVGGEKYGDLDGPLIEIDRIWSPGDRIQVTIPLTIRVVLHGDKTMKAVAFVRGPQVLASDTAIAAAEGIPGSPWWGSDLFVHMALQDGVEREFQLVPFADAGQNREDYAAIHAGIGMTGEAKESVQDTSAFGATPSTP